MLGVPAPNRSDLLRSVVPQSRVAYWQLRHDSRTPQPSGRCDDARPTAHDDQRSREHAD